MQNQSLTAKGIWLNPILASLLMISLGLEVAAHARDNPQPRGAFEFQDASYRHLTGMALDTLTVPGRAQGSPANAQAAEAAVRDGETAFKLGDMDKALAAYKHAFELNPRSYDAALYAGDAEFVKAKKSNDAQYRNTHLDAAGTWFAKAINIDPNRPKAYQYWGDALDAQGRTNEALLRFVDAIIADPYDKMPYLGLTQWAARHKAQLGHPKIEPPNSPANPNGQTTVNIDPRTLNSADGTSNWLMYSQTRAAWSKKDFFINYPAEKVYRHSLREEAAALRAVATACAKDLQLGKVKTLEPSLQMLLKLSEDGFVEAYVLFARPDEGIARDYPAYRAANKDTLKRYWLSVVVLPG